jgi:HK97 gp10 family phage protein
MAASVKMTWHDKRIVKELGDELVTRLNVAGQLIVSEIRRNISEPGPAASAPGDYPHAQTGYLRQTITYNVDAKKLELVAGATAEYAQYLEEGTANMAARPFILRTIRDITPKIKAIMTKPKKGWLSKLAASVVNAFRGSPSSFTTTRV